MKKKIKVVAIRLGYYNYKRVKEGVNFEISSEKEFSKSWMRKLVKAKKEDEYVPEKEEDESSENSDESSENSESFNSEDKVI